MSEGPKHKYLGRFACLEDDGPLLLVVCFTHPQGRWCSELQLAALQHVSAQLIEKSALLQGERVHSQHWQIQGLLVMSAWRLVKAIGCAFTSCTEVKDIASRQVMHNLLLYQCSAGVQAALEFPIIAASFFSEPPVIDMPDFDLDDYNHNLDSPRFAAGTWDGLSRLTDIHEVNSDGHVAPACSVNDLWRRWARRYQLPTTSNGVPALVGWRVWSAIGSLMCRGAWFGDVVAIQRRVTGRFAVRLRTEAPPSKLVREYIQIKAATSHA